MQLYLKTFLFISFLISSLGISAQHDLDALIVELEDYMKQRRIPGMMLSIVRADTVLFSGGLGFANIEQEEKVTAQHLFRQGSISKTFTALGILKLQDQGKLKLSDPILKIDPTLPIKNKWAKNSPIRIEHVLEHTAGFDEMHLHAIYNREDETAPPTSKLMEINKESLYARWEPGTRMSYSNPGFVVAGHMIETVANQPYQDFLKDQIIDPIGMPSSAFYFKEPQNGWMSQGYYNEGGKYFPIDFVSIQGGPAGELCSNAVDMGAFLQFMLRKKITNEENTIINESNFERMENSLTSLAGKKGLPGGYGLGNGSRWMMGHRFQGHNGGIDGFSSDYTYSRSADLGVAVAINKSDRVGHLLYMVVQHFLKDQMPEANDRITAPIPEDLAKEFEGFYTYQHPRNQITDFMDQYISGVSLDFEENLVQITEIFGTVVDTLYYAGNKQFYSRNEGLPFAILMNDKKGRQIFWPGSGYGVKSSKLLTWIKLIALVFSALVAIPYLLYGLIWFIIKMVKKKKQKVGSRLVLWLTALFYTLMPILYIGIMGTFRENGTLNSVSILFFVCSILFFAFSIGSFLFAFKLGEEKKGFKFYYRLTSFCLFGLALFLLNQGLIGFQAWSY